MTLTLTVSVSPSLDLMAAAKRQQPSRRTRWAVSGRSAAGLRGRTRWGSDDHGQDDGHGLVCGLDSDDADDLLGRVCPYDAGISGPRRLPRCAGLRLDLLGIAIQAKSGGRGPGSDNGIHEGTAGCENRPGRGRDGVGRLDAWVRH